MKGTGRILNQEWDYTLADHRELPEPRPVMRLRRLTATMRATVEDSYMERMVEAGSNREVMKFYRGAHALRVLRVGLVGCRGWLDSAGVEIKIKSLTPTSPDSDLDANLAPFTWGQIHELADEIMEENGLSETDIKN